MTRRYTNPRLPLCVSVCIRLNDDHRELLLQRDLLVKRLEQNSASQCYLESVVESAEDFHEIREITARYDTLISTRRVSLSHLC